MNTRMVLCLALVAFAVPAFAGTAPQTLLSAPKVAVDVNVDVQKVPIVSLADAPCKEVCKDKCKVTIEKNCTKVPVEVKECLPSTKTVTTKLCSKKCALTFTTPKVLKGISIDKNATSLDKGLQLKGAVSAEQAVSAEADASVQADLSTGKGRKLQGLKAAAKLAAAKLAVDGMTNIVKNIGVPSCSEVCDDVEFEMPDLECKMVTHMVDKCEANPKKVCEKDCLCIPMKTININLPKKSVAASLSVNQQASVVAEEAKP